MSKLKYLGLATGTAINALWSKDRAIRYLTEGLGKIPGVPAKFAQVLSSKLGMYSAEEQSSPEPLPIDWVKEIIKEQSPMLARAIRELEGQAITASLSQVHRATLWTSENVIIKLQLPFVKENLSEQMKILGQALKISPAAKFDLNAGDITEYFEKSLLEELDYTKEAQSQTKFEEIFRDHPHIKIPKVYSAYSTTTMLVQEQAKGISLNEIAKLPAYDRQIVANSLTEFIFYSLRVANAMHGDLQAQNWKYDPESKHVWIYDFGNVVYLPTSQKQDSLSTWGSIVKLIQSAISNDIDSLLESYFALGFSQKHLEHLDREELLQVTKILVQPFAEHTWNASQWNLSETFENRFGKSKWWFRTAGPAWFLHLMRTLAYWAKTMVVLDCPISSRKYSEQILGLQLISPTTTQKSTDADLKITSERAQFLVVQIFENNRLKIESEMPATAVELIDEILSDETLAEISRQGKDIIQIKKDLLASGLKKQSVLDFECGNKRYLVRLI